MEAAKLLRESYHIAVLFDAEGGMVPTLIYGYSREKRKSVGPLYLDMGDLRKYTSDTYLIQTYLNFERALGRLLLVFRLPFFLFFHLDRFLLVYCFSESGGKSN